MKQRDAMRFLHMGCGESLQTSRVTQVTRKQPPVKGAGRGSIGVKPAKGGKNHEGQR